MGASFTNCNVRTKNAAKCSKVLASSIRSRALMTDSKNGWITVYDEESKPQDVNILVLRHLIEKGKPDTKFAASLRMAFGSAVMAGHTKVIRHLIRAGAVVNENTRFGQPPLLLASMRGQEFIWEAKMNRPFPIRPDQPKTNGKEVVMMLLEAGAEIPFPTKNGPVDVKTLSTEGKEKLATALLEAASKIKLPGGTC